MTDDPQVRIPRSQHGLFSSLARLDDDVFAQVIDSLERLPDVLNRADLLARLEPLWPFEDPTPPQLLDGLLGLSAAVQIQRWSVALTAGAAARQIEIADDEASPDFYALLANRLETILGGRNLRLSAKAVSLAHEVPNEMQSARVLTDLRPVFDREDVGTASPVGMMVLTTLRLDYFSEEGGGAFLVTLNDEQVTRLQEDLGWAAQKADGLRALVAQFDLSLHRREENG